jgi:hypothetical protein
MAKFLHAKYPPTISTARKTERYERAAEYSGGSGGGAIVRISAAAVICEADGRTGTAHSRRVRISVGSHRRTRHPVLVLSSSLTRSRCLLFVLTHGHGQESWLSTPNDGLVRALPVDTVLPEPSTLRNTAALRASAPGRPIASGFVRICPNATNAPRAHVPAVRPIRTDVSAVTHPGPKFASRMRQAGHEKVSAPSLPGPVCQWRISE